MYFQIDGEKVTGYSPAKENLKSAVEASLPEDFDYEPHTLSMLKWDGKKVGWKSKAALADIKATQAEIEKAAEFKAKTGITREVFDVLKVVKKLANMDVPSVEDRAKLHAFVAKYEEAR